MIDFTSSDFHRDPYPALSELRAASSPVWHGETNMFLAARHSDANAVLRDKNLGRIFSPRQPDTEWFDFNWLHADSILDSEPPKHTRLKSLISKAFNPTTIRALKPDIERLTNGLLDTAEARLRDEGGFDLIADVSEPLPVKVIAFMLGFPEQDEHLLRPWSQAIVKMYEVSPTEQHRADARTASNEFADYVRNLMVERKKNPGADLISVLASVEDAGQTLTEHELIATCVLLLNAGHEASVNGFGNGAVAALERPDTIRALREDPRGVAPTAVEEFLRFDSPLQLFERTATSDTEIGGVLVKRGQKIAALLGSANRDDDVFDNATTMDLTRQRNPHIGFGAGIHFCIGAPLARLELNVLLPAVFERFPRLELAKTPERRAGFVLRGYQSVHVSG